MLMAAAEKSKFFDTLLVNRHAEEHVAEIQDETDFDWTIDQPLAVPGIKPPFLDSNTKDSGCFELPFPESDYPVLLYSDLFFDSIESKSAFEAAHGANVRDDGTPGALALKTLVLQHSEEQLSNPYLRSFTSVGWGFELLSMESGNALVGRIDENSAAFCCGLRSGDCILKVNAKPTSDIGNFAQVFLGGDFGRMLTDKCKQTCLVSLREAVSTGRRPGPLILHVQRRLDKKDLISIEPHTQQEESETTSQSTESGQKDLGTNEQGASPQDPQHAMVQAGQKSEMVVNNRPRSPLYIDNPNFGSWLLKKIQGDRKLCSPFTAVGLRNAALRAFEIFQAAGYTFATRESRARNVLLNDDTVRQIFVRLVSTAYSSQSAGALDRAGASRGNSGSVFDKNHSKQSISSIERDANPKNIEQFDSSPLTPHQHNMVSQCHPLAPTPQMIHQGAKVLPPMLQGPPPSPPITYVHSHYKFLVTRLDLESFRRCDLLTRSDLHVSCPGEICFTIAEVGVCKDQLER
jgi:hypothetical protein